MISHSFFGKRIDNKLFIPVMLVRHVVRIVGLFGIVLHTSSNNTNIIICVRARTRYYKIVHSSVLDDDNFANKIDWIDIFSKERLNGISRNFCIYQDVR